MTSPVLASLGSKPAPNDTSIDGKMLIYAKLPEPKARKRRTKTGELPPCHPGIANSCLSWFVEPPTLLDGEASHQALTNIQISKQLRKKCDEGLPSCSRCLHKSKQCKYGIARSLIRVAGETTAEFGLNGLPHIDTSPGPGSSTGSLSTAGSDDYTYAQSFDVDKDTIFLTGSEARRGSCSGTSPTSFPSFDCAQPQANRICSAPWWLAGAPGDLSPRFELPIVEVDYPLFSEFSNQSGHQMLLHHFYTVLSGLVIFEPAPNGPYTELLMQLAREDEAVTFALYAFASAHLELMGVDCSCLETPADFQALAVQGIRSSNERQFTRSSQDAGTLGVLLFLVHYEVLLVRGIECQTQLIRQYLEEARQILALIPDSKKSPTINFLQRSFQYYNVITDLSLEHPHLDASDLGPRSSSCSQSVYNPSDMFPLAFTSETPTSLVFVDPILGMTTSLWPILHRLGSLLCVKQDLNNKAATEGLLGATGLKAAYEVMKKAIDYALRAWIPPRLPCFSSDDREDIPSAMGQATYIPTLEQIAVAYRHSALVFFHRRIYEHPTTHTEVQYHAHLALTYCVAAVSTGGALNGLLWPLFIASCEAVTDKDRASARVTFTDLIARRGMMNIERAWAVVVAAWNAVDLSVSQDIRSMPTEKTASRQALDNLGANLILA